MACYVILISLSGHTMDLSVSAAVVVSRTEPCVPFEGSQELKTRRLSAPFSDMGPFDMLHFNSIVPPFRDQHEPRLAHADTICSWMRCILGNLLNEGIMYREQRSRLSA